ncbi:hypothetical protein [Candidatus Nitrosocosmicus arcticus]|uniref:Uncharacterized protein n=1 Tax=Candidatus Nitrosocosmicus arcticus TaxID=2035267 RepID=A0A557SX15_9ARCH|nr:hypothetical protein [Candidatus Nitrosocosmicus arcticus]TVP41148.1 hypothetical protein NARC_40111 [Candidatus Nitrosocosmicus arcticus]
MQITDNDELKRYLLDRNDILVSTNLSNEEELFNNETGESAIDRYPSSLFNKKVSLMNDDFVGFMMEITDTKITIFGDYDQRFDVPKSKAREVNNNMVLDMEWSEFISYRLDDSDYNSQELTHPNR